jgi:hypothetical protein
MSFSFVSLFKNITKRKKEIRKPQSLVPHLLCGLENQKVVVLQLINNISCALAFQFNKNYHLSHPHCYVN